MFSHFSYPFSTNCQLPTSSKMDKSVSESLISTQNFKIFAPSVKKKKYSTKFEAIGTFYTLKFKFPEFLRSSSTYLVTFRALLVRISKNENVSHSYFQLHTSSKADESINESSNHSTLLLI